jgi:outer membrane protein TolC
MGNMVTVPAGKAPGRPSALQLAALALWPVLIAGCASEESLWLSQTAYPPDASAKGPGTDKGRSAAGFAGPQAASSPAARSAGAALAPGPLGSPPQARPGSLSTAPASKPGPVDADVKRVAEEQAIAVPSPLVIPPPSGEYPIDLPTALKLADVSNPTIGAARAMVLHALGMQMTACSLLLPSFNGGASYRGHNGPLQRTSGQISSLSEQAFFIGAGARITSTTITIPGVSIFTPLTDAWFEPLAARQNVAAARFHAGAAANEILLDVADLDIELLGNQSILDAQRLSESQAYEIVKIADSFAVTGQGRKADAERTKAEWKLRRAAVQKAEESVAVTAARLANRLNLDPAVRLVAIGGPLVPLELMDLGTPPQELIQIALKNRPDLASQSALIAEAEIRRKEEVGRPLLPTLWLGFVGGAFGGGSNLSPPLLGRFAGRTDSEVRVYWTLLNMGAGNLALIRQRDAELGQAVAERQRTINRARSEIASALAEAQAAAAQIEMARHELESSALGFHQDLDRARNNLVRPIEVVNSLTLLAEARVNLVQALITYDQSEFRLWVALGFPPPLIDPATPTGAAER